MFFHNVVLNLKLKTLNFKLLDLNIKLNQSLIIMRIWKYITGFFFIFLVMTFLSGEEKMKKFIYLIPVGDIDKNILEMLKESLKEEFGFECKIGDKIEIPQKSYNESRKQYFSTTILDELKKVYKDDTERILGVIDKDLFVPRLNFVFGEASMGIRPSAIISVTRLRQEFYGLPDNEELFKRRLITEAVHELGHTYQLQHCFNPKCVMFFSNSLMDTDKKGYNFCDDCRKLLKGQK